MPAKASKHAIEKKEKKNLIQDYEYTIPILDDETIKKAKLIEESTQKIIEATKGPVTSLNVSSFGYRKKNENLNNYRFSASELMKYEMGNQNLREILESGAYVYCDGLICINDRSLFMRSDGLLRVKPIVKMRPDLFCLRKEEITEQKDDNTLSSIRFIRAKKDRR